MAGSLPSEFNGANLDLETVPELPVPESDILALLTDPPVRNDSRDHGELIENAKQGDVVAQEQLRQLFASDHAFLIQALDSDGLLLEYAPDSIKQCRPIALRAARNNPAATQFLSPELLADEEVAHDLIYANGTAFRYFSSSIRANETFVSAALQDTPDALQYAAPELRVDRYFLERSIEAAYERNIPLTEINILHEGLHNNPSAIAFIAEYAPEMIPELLPFCRTVHDEHEVVLLGLNSLNFERENGVLDKLSERFHTTPEISEVIHLRKKQLEVYENFRAATIDFGDIPPKFRSDAVLATNLVSRNGMLLEKLPEEMRRDARVVSSALKSDWRAFSHVSDLVNMEHLRELHPSLSIDSSRFFELIRAQTPKRNLERIMPPLQAIDIQEHQELLRKQGLYETAIRRNL